MPSPPDSYMPIPPATTQPHRRPPLIPSSSRGNVFYRPRDPLDRRSVATTPPSFPSPRIRPRQRRPHSIHILAYPSGFIPLDLREPESSLSSRRNADPKRKKSRKPQEDDQAKKNSEQLCRNREEGPGKKRSLLLKSQKSGIRVLEKLFSVLSPPSRSTAAPGSLPPSGAGPIPPPPPPPAFATPPSTAPPRPRARPRPLSFAGFARRLSRADPVDDDPMVSVTTMVDAIRPLSMAHAVAANNHRNSMTSVRSGKSIASASVAEIQKPVASGSGVSCSILLAEPNVFLTGFDHDGHTRQSTQNGTALLRGKLQLTVSKNVKIKAITLRLVGKARTEWPEGIPPLKVDYFEEETLRTQSLMFFHAMHEGIWETPYGNQCSYQLKGNTSPSGGGPLGSATFPTRSIESLHLTGRHRHSSSLSAKELKRLSLQSVNSRSFGKGDNPVANPVQAKGYKIFHPGTYEYSFELPIDHHQLETTKLPFGSVKWELEATVERAGAFKPNLHGTREVSIVRVPDQLSLEMTEPISISRQWEDQMYYDIIISGKSFPIGGKIPIAFKLTPLAKVQLHKLKVFVTENVEYWTNDRRVTRKDPGRKILLLEKAAGKPMDKQFERSEFRVLSGGELSPEEREDARRAAERRRELDAARSHRPPEPLPEPSENLLGDLDLGLETYWGSTEIEMNVQIPTCDMMAKDKSLRLHPDCSWKNVHVYHWIKVVMRISRADPEDPAGKRRRHFEISIDSPFTVLNCRATQANTFLPQYSSGDGSTVDIDFPHGQPMSCGCPDAVPVGVSPSSSTASLPTPDVGTPELHPSRPRSAIIDRVIPSALPVPPQAAHTHDQSQATSHRVTALASSSTWPSSSSSSSSPSSSSSRTSSATMAPSPLHNVQNQDAAPQAPRPIELLRWPSYNPPAFDEDDPPPPLATPPPNYDAIIGTPSVDGLADYFQRLADYEGAEHPDDEEGGERARTPTGVRPAAAAGDYLSAATTSSPSSSSATPATNGGAVEARLVDEDDSDSGDEDHPARIHRGGRVNVANPRTPGGRLVPSRSLDIERPVIRLSMANVVRRGA
ncbi:hypothetical protein VTK73DRAFT_6448 [Phialemonium thermophilum]|uniref:Arrestin C-terminal-like domain-containing protein n=1 Tax=Phialemonium thermophilum TaxID=223376 RepID=A0ABR3WJV5_9PEZI